MMVDLSRRLQLVNGTRVIINYAAIFYAAVVKKSPTCPL